MFDIIGFLFILGIIISVILTIVFAIAARKPATGDSLVDHPSPAVPLSPPELYYSGRSEAVMTNAEIRFFKRLEGIVAGKYYVFPQVHLSSLMVNKTVGRYQKLAYQRLLRRSVDYVLADKHSLKTMYAVELDDWSHDSAKRQARDRMVEDMLTKVDITLVRFRDADTLSDDQIIEKFTVALKRQSDFGGIV